MYEVCVLIHYNGRTHTLVEQVYFCLVDAVLLWQIAPAFQSRSANSRARIAEPLVVRQEIFRGKERRVGEGERENGGIREGEGWKEREGGRGWKEREWERRRIEGRERRGSTAVHFLYQVFCTM